MNYLVSLTRTPCWSWTSCISIIWDLLQTQVPRPHFRPYWIWDSGPAICFNKSSEWLWCMLRFEEQFPWACFLNGEAFGIILHGIILPLRSGTSSIPDHCSIRVDCHSAPSPPFLNTPQGEKDCMHNIRSLAKFYRHLHSGYLTTDTYLIPLKTYLCFTTYLH